MKSENRRKSRGVTKKGMKLLTPFPSEQGRNPFRSHMATAMDEARRAERSGEVPIGAVVADRRGNLIARAGNAVRRLKDPTAHAELIALRIACQRAGNERLDGFSLFSTLEPCIMCAAAIAHARIARLYYAASDPKSGGIEGGPRVYRHSQCHHVPEVYPGIGAGESERLLEDFFRRLRNPK